MPKKLQPREELDRVGVEHVSDVVLLSVILRSGVHGMNVVELAVQLLKDYGSFTELTKASIDELASVKGMGKVKAQVLMAALEIAKRLSLESVPERCRIKTPEDAACLLREEVRTLEREVFWILMLDTRNHLKRVPVDVTRGLLDASLIHPREVFREAIRSMAAAVVLIHNHPSGDCTPSAEDIRITKQLVAAGQIVDIKVLDHVILGKKAGNDKNDFLSLREQGIVEF
ncbi:DNA repair protein RadC [Verrucomicrobiota bacterium]